MLRFADDVAVRTVGDGVQTTSADGRIRHLPGAAADLRRLAAALRTPRPAEAVWHDLTPPAAALLTLLVDELVVVDDPVPDRVLALHRVTLAAGDAREDGRRDEAHLVTTRPAGGPVMRLAPSRLRGDLADALASRRSCSSFAETPCEPAVVGDLLGAAFGASADHRAYPSAGGLYPVELIIGALHVAGADAGMSLQYDANGHTLRAGATLPPMTWQAALPGLGSLRPPVVVLLTVDVSRPSVSRYAERGYRLALLEAGHLAQNLMLVAAAAGLGSLGVGAVEEEVLVRGAVVPHAYQVVVYAVALGSPSVPL
jgi:SagB-type dehydrogenase family enzyme